MTISKDDINHLIQSEPSPSNQRTTFHFEEVFDGVKPLTENSLERLTYTISVQEKISVDDAPDGLIILAGDDVHLHYQKVDLLPREIQYVIRSAPGTSNYGNKEMFIEKVKRLLEYANSLPERPHPKYKVGDIVKFNIDARYNDIKGVIISVTPQKYTESYDYRVCISGCDINSALEYSQDALEFVDEK